MEYIAHINNIGQKQSVKEHSLNTARICSENSIQLFKNTCYYIGLLHDIGKYQNSFQKRINGLNIKVEHSVCGAKEAVKYKSLAGFLAALCIAGHHTGLPDFGNKPDSNECPTLYGRLKRDTEDYSVFREDLIIPAFNDEEVNNILISDCESESELIERYAFIVRYCFSCLVDADTIDTKEFCTRETSEKLSSDFSECLSKIESILNSFVCNTDLQKSRSLLQEQVFSHINKDSEIYLLNMPTGSGKTLTGMKCALYRALKTEKKRIIYVIPYNSIIEQTADVFDTLFGDSARILRHQSSFSYEDSDYDEDYKKIAISATENWNADIIITTSVQFFESVYSNKRSKLRKLHNMADSIIVFDEVHMMPIEYLQACLRAVAYLTKYFNSEAIFMTATMPDFRSIISQYALSKSHVENLVTDTSLFDKFRKNTYHYLNKISDDELLEKSEQYSSSLIVVNSRKKARELYDKASGKKYHLSTYMTVIDRERTINEIKKQLQIISSEYGTDTEVPCEERITVVSTSLIEAGVDLDFNCAFRELNGLDNILQTGGRCNREGKSANGDVFIFRSADNNSTLEVEQSCTIGIIDEFDDISSEAAIRTYYERLLQFKKDMIQENSLGNICKSPYSIPFDSYSVKLIKNNTKSVVVPDMNDPECVDLIHALMYNGTINIRRIQKYCASIKIYELTDLLNQGAVKEYGSEIYVLENSDYYDKNTGIQFNSKDIYF